MRLVTVGLLTVGLGLTATTAHAAKVKVEVLHPAEAPLPAHVQRVTVIDRSGAKNAGQAVLGALESAVSGEALRGDRDGAKQAVATMVELLRASPAYEVVHVRTDRKQAEASLWDTVMTPGAVRDLCASRCDAVVSLEAFDTDSSVQGATRSTGAVATWRVYDGRTGRVLDSERMHAGSYSYAGAGVGLDQVLNRRVTGSVGDGTALAYGERIAPTWQLEARRLLGTQRGLRAGIRAAKVGDWARATAAWEQVIDSGNARQRAKARFNLAVASEAQGELDRAIGLASAAHATLGRRASRNLSVRLRSRETDDARLAEQLAAR